MEILNRKVNHDYFIDEVFEAGIALTGTEIKSIRNGDCNIKDCYGIIRNHEVYLLNMYVGLYKEGNIFNHEESRDRKLLLHKKEIRKLEKYIELKGYTLIPTKLYFKENKLKVALGVCHGKKEYDKRETIKQRDIQREVAKNLKRY
ncbi:MAG: SsrA-binding protein SmpB [Bacilli bacterium]|nr:SsrA-binding protein SmpB [Bacilli bacterium]